jgi:hypothetical protein
MPKKYIFAAVILSICLPAHAKPTTAPVSGFAKSFVLGKKIANATITILENGHKLYTDKNGNFGPFQYPVGQPITLQFKKWGYQTTQSGTITVPPEGLTSPYDNITFQVPSIVTYHFLAKVIGAPIDDNSCHVTTTITAYHKTLDDDPQGIADAVVTIKPAINVKPFYFDIFKTGVLKEKTNPFTRGLKKTSKDGGVAFFNLQPSNKPYTISAVKEGKHFSEAKFICKKGAFINISPPNGPTELGS